MSNYLAVATVTATLQRILQASVQADVDGARVTTVRPENSGGSTPETGINLYLYQAKPVVWRNADLPTRYGPDQLVKRPQIALDLFYLVTFYGNEVELEPQRLLGSVVRTLHSRPSLSREVIREAINDATFGFLVDSDLADQLEEIKIAPLPLSTDELSKIWSVFFQTPYALSVAYQVSAVSIESEDIPKRALPVRGVWPQVVPYLPRIERILSRDELMKVWRSTPDQPVLPGSTLCVRGKDLQGEITRVRIGGVDVEPEEVSSTQAIVNLGAAPEGFLRAGIQGLQLVHWKASINGSRRIVESNAAAIILRPAILAVEIGAVEQRGDGLRAADLSVAIHPTVGALQRAVLVLNELDLREPSAYTFTAAPRPEAGAVVRFRILDVKPSTYLVRVRIDGAESLLGVDLDEQSPTHQQYVQPRVVLP